MSPYSPPPSGSYELPSWGHRIAVAVLIAVPFALFFIVLPGALGGVLTSHGLPFPYPTGLLLDAGLLLTVLGLTRYLMRPTRWFGPVSLLYFGTLIAYLLWLASISTVSVRISGATLTIGYSELMLLFALVPSIRLLGAVVTTVEDAVRPGERYPIDYPPRRIPGAVLPPQGSGPRPIARA